MFEKSNPNIIAEKIITGSSFSISSMLSLLGVTKFIGVNIYNFLF